MQAPQVSHVAANHQSRRANYGWHSATVIYVLKCKDVKTDDHGNDIAASNSPFRLHLTERARKGLHLGVDNCHRPTCKQTNTHIACALHAASLSRQPLRRPTLAVPSRHNINTRPYHAIHAPYTHTLPPPLRPLHLHLARALPPTPPIRRLPPLQNLHLLTNPHIPRKPPPALRLPQRRRLLPRRARLKWPREPRRRTRRCLGQRRR